MTDTLTVPHDLLQRVMAEFLEMPGMQITRRQAQRLWGCDDVTCGQLLDLLVDSKFLRQIRIGTYGRSEDVP